MDSQKSDDRLEGFDPSDVREHRDAGSLEELLEMVLSWVVEVSSLSREQAGEWIAHSLERQGSSLSNPTHATVNHVLDFVEESFGGESSPPDLELSITSLRRSLAVI